MAREKRASAATVDGRKALSDLRALTEEIAAQEDVLRQGGGTAGRERQKRLGRLTARERISRLLDPGEEPLELGLWAGWGMYPPWGEVPAAGVLVVIGKVHGRPCMIVANDATVKAGAFFPQTVKKVLRAQRIAFECNLPILYLVDSAGAFLPMQDEIFPDEDDFGRIFRNNSILSAAGVPQFAAIMGSCIAGGAYLPVLCDKLLMTEGSGLYLAGPALVKAAIGQVVDAEELGGAAMHAEISGTVDFREPDDEACLARLRRLVDLLPLPPTPTFSGAAPERDAMEVYDLVGADGRKEYDARRLLASVVDAGSLEEYKQSYGQSVVTAYARIGGRQIGVVANQKTRVKTARGEIQLGGVLYADSADKAARFVMDSNQIGLPIVFFMDVTGFMVGRDAEQSGIIRSGAKLVSAVSNSTSPKITVIVGGSFGAGNYAMCGKAYDPRFLFAWPNAKYAVMGADQAADTLFTVQQKQVERQQKETTPEEMARLREQVKADYQRKTDIRYGAARGWVDAIIAPHRTREVLEKSLALVTRTPPAARFHTGVLQV